MMSAYILLSLLIFIGLVMTGAMLLAWLQFSREKHILLWAGA